MDTIDATNLVRATQSVVQRRTLWSSGELSSQLNLLPLIASAGRRLGPSGAVTEEMRRVLKCDFSFSALREGKQFGEDVYEIVNDGLGHSVVGHVEEADVGQGDAEACQDGIFA